MSDSDDDDDRSASGSGSGAEDDDESGSRSGSGDGSDDRGSGDDSGSEKGSNNDDDDDSQNDDNDDDDNSGNDSDESEPKAKKKKEKKKGKMNAIDDLPEEKKKADDDEMKQLLEKYGKPNAFDSLLSTLKDINSDLDDLSTTVDCLHLTYSPRKDYSVNLDDYSQMINGNQNYHPPLPVEEQRRQSYSPRRFEDFDNRASQTLGRHTADNQIQTDEYYSDNEAQAQLDYPQGPPQHQAQNSYPQSQQYEGQQLHQSTQRPPMAPTSHPMGQANLSFQQQKLSQIQFNQPLPPQMHQGHPRRDIMQGVPQAPYYSGLMQPYQRKFSPAGRFANAPSTAQYMTPYVVAGAGAGGMMPQATTYSQFYRNQSALQAPMIRENMSQLGPGYQTFQGTPGFSQMGITMQNQNPLNNSAQPFNQGRQEQTEPQRVEDLQSAINTLLQ